MHLLPRLACESKIAAMMDGLFFVTSLKSSQIPFDLYNSLSDYNGFGGITNLDSYKRSFPRFAWECRQDALRPVLLIKIG